ncbi:MAG: Ig-like domain-containing protein, partial [Gemmatimonadota bacterium]|nr:Ig-like domain-containing protein [Gemmatimonadota bacterium]
MTYSRSVYPALLALALGACGGETAPKVTSVTVSPATSTLNSLGETVRFTARVRDVDGADVPGQSVVWSSSDESVLTINSGGTGTSVAAGTAQVTATVGTVTGTANVTVDPRPAVVSRLQGDGQSGTVTDTLPVILKASVADARGNRLPGVDVTFTVIQGAGSVAPASAVSDQNGEVAAEWVLGTIAGTQRVRVRAGAMSADFNATALPGPPVEFRVAGGDGQEGGLFTTLPDPLAVALVDQYQNGIAGGPVTFTTTAGSLSAAADTTDAAGLATTALTLPLVEGPVTVSATTPGFATVDFSVTAIRLPLSVATDTLARARSTVPYSGQLQARGGSGTGYSWSFFGGSLPSGVSLGADGVVSGTPATAGDFTFTAQLTDGDGLTATGDVVLSVCEAGVSLARGQVLVRDLPAPGACGIFLPSGANGDRYRVTVVRTTSTPDAFDVHDVRLTVTGEGVSAAAPTLVASPSWSTGARKLTPSGEAALARSARVAESTARFHAEMRAREEEMMRRLPRGQRLGASPPAWSPSTAPIPAAAPASVRFNTATSCSAASAFAPGLKVAENDDMVIYQDSVQRQTKAVSVTQAQRMLDYYTNHSKAVIEAYFGRPSDVDANGRIVVFASPVVEEGVAAFVWAGDMLSKGVCANSNHMELVFFNTDVIRDMDDPSPGWQALPTLAHEVKHVVSLYHRIRAYEKGITDGTDANPFGHPDWMEEGAAEIAGEMSSRIAWAATGGPSVGAEVLGNHFFVGQSGDVRKENYGVLLRLWRSVFYLWSQPNGVVETPLNAHEGHSIYGSGWHFLRWLGDAYGNAATPQGDAPLFRAMTDSTRISGLPTLEAQVGMSFSGLLEEYATAITLHATGAPAPTRTFTTYDFVSSTGIWNFAESTVPDPPVGHYPWPVTTDSWGDVSATFQSAS